MQIKFNYCRFENNLVNLQTNTLKGLHRLLIVNCILRYALSFTTVLCLTASTSTTTTTTTNTIFP